MPSFSTSRNTAVLALILVQVIFGLNFAASKVILEHYPPVLWAGMRLAIASLLMFMTAFLIVPKEQRKTDLDFLKRCFFYGFIGITINQVFFLLGLKLTTTTNAAILNSLTPIMTLLFAILAGSEKFTFIKGFGFLLAVTGAVVIRKFEDFNLGSDTFKGDLFTLVNCAALALFFTLSRDFLKKNSPFWVTAWMFLFGAIELLAVSTQDFSHLIPAVFDTHLVLAILYNIFLATMLTYFLNSWTLTRVQRSFVAIFIYLQPAIAIGYAWCFGGESPSARVLLAISLIFAGVTLGVVVKKT